MFGQPGDAPQHRFNRQRIERRQRIFRFVKDIAMVNDADLRRKLGRQLRDLRNLVVGNDPYPPHPRRIVGDGTHAIIQLITADPAMGVGAIIVERRTRESIRLRLGLCQIEIPLCLMRGVRPVDPCNDCIDLYHSPTIYAPFFAAVGLCSGFGKCKIFGAKDGSDNDYNDTFLQIQCFTRLG